MLRLLEELVYSFRREGFVVSTAQAIDCVRAAEVVGFDDRATLRDALAAIVVERPDDLERFRLAFDRFFAGSGPHPGDLFARLVARGFTKEEAEIVRELLEQTALRTSSGALALRALTGPPSELDHILSIAGIRAELARVSSAAQVGFFAERAGAAMGTTHAATAVRALKRALADALGAERGAALGDALEEELALMRRRVRAHVEEKVRAAGDPAVATAPAFAAATSLEAIEMRRAVRRIAEKLRGREQVRKKHARRGRIDAGRTVRRALRTGGVPFVMLRKRPRRERPRLVLLCDVSESVRSASSFMLEFVAQVMELFADARSFVFVGEAAETTALFREAGTARALATIASGGVVSLASTSNYGRAIEGFERALRGSIDRRTTIAVLGDGRTNHKADGAEALERLRGRARALVWICPEPRSAWGSGDSAMQRYARIATSVLPARTVRELEDAARALVRLR